MNLLHFCETIFTFTNRVRSLPRRASNAHVLQFGRQTFWTLFLKICWPQNEHLLGTCTDHYPSWEAKRFSASQEIPQTSWDTKIHYRVHESPPPVLSCARLVQSKPPSHFFKKHFNILPSTPGFSRRSLPTDPSTKTLSAPPIFPIRSTCPANLIIFYLTTKITVGEYRSLWSSFKKESVYDPLNF